LLAVDHWSDAVSTYKQNFPIHQAIQADVSTIDETALRKLLPKSPEWVVGGPPCQGFSTVGRRERDDPRNRLVQEFARIVNLLSPTGFLVENVVGLRDMNFVDAVVDLFNGIGYAVTPLVLKSADYGVPQLRHRIIFVGSRSGQQFRKPKPHPAGIVTVWDAIGDLPPLAPGEEAFEYLTDAVTGYQQRMRTGSQGLQGHVASSHPAHLVKAISFIPDGGNRLSIPDEFQPASGFHNSYARLHSNSPAVAVTQNMGKPSGTRCIHPFQHRGLTAREGARLQGFPDVFHFTSGVTSQRLQIANAVSPILAEMLGNSVCDKKSWTCSPTQTRKQKTLAFSAD
jgi:DNA (cytosine-5)-methyltransferase 1